MRDHHPPATTTILPSKCVTTIPDQNNKQWCQAVLRPSAVFDLPSPASRPRLVSACGSPRVAVGGPRCPRVVVVARCPRVVVAVPRYPRVVVAVPRCPRVVVAVPRLRRVVVAVSHCPRVVVAVARYPRVVVAVPRCPRRSTLSLGRCRFRLSSRRCRRPTLSSPFHAILGSLPFQAVFASSLPFHAVLAVQRYRCRFPRCPCVVIAVTRCRRVAVAFARCPRVVVAVPCYAWVGVAFHAVLSSFRCPREDGKTVAVHLEFI